MKCMSVPSFRFLLPSCSVALDLILLVAAIHAVDGYRSTLRQSWPLWQQRYEAVDSFFLRNAYHAMPPEPLQAIYLGTLPVTIAAGLISEALFPNGWLAWRLSSPFDFRWACLNLAFAIVFW